MSHKLETTLEISSLFNLYKPLLTDKQKTYLEWYVDEDLSLQEIADHFQVSRNAVYDSIQKTVRILRNFEKKLHLVENKNKIQGIIEKHKTTTNAEVQAILKALIEE